MATFDFLQGRKLIWIKIAEYFSRELSEAQLKMYAEDTEPITPRELEGLFRIYRKEISSRFPLPKDLMDLRNGIHEQSEHETIQLIHGAIKKYGAQNWTWAKKMVGPEGEAVVLAFGGWYDLCKSMGKSLSVSIFFAQSREIIRAYRRVQNNQRIIGELNNFRLEKSEKENNKLNRGNNESTESTGHFKE